MIFYILAVCTRCAAVIRPHINATCPFLYYLFLYSSSNVVIRPSIPSSSVSAYIPCLASFAEANFLNNIILVLLCSESVSKTRKLFFFFHANFTGGVHRLALDHHKRRSRRSRQPVRRLWWGRWRCDGLRWKRQNGWWLNVRGQGVQRPVA